MPPSLTREPQVPVRGRPYWAEAEAMVQKVSEIVGVSPKSFAKAAEDAIAEAGKTVRGMKWARISEFEMELEGSKIKSYRATVRIYFDVQR